MIQAVILAAGRSSRMGTPKPLLKIKGKTFLQHIAGCLYQAGIQKITVVLGFNARYIQAAAPPELNYVVNHNFDNGQFSSLQCGIRHLEPERRGVLVCLGDQPHIQVEWVKKIMETLKNTPGDIFIPVFQGKSGHPVLYSSALFQKILSMSPTQTARDLRNDKSVKLVHVPLQSSGILQDADYPEDIKQIKKFF
ncbi:nucleotidyltransferase family protein [candidate division KSB1 bacterium]|nr:nucleotidyltransferase family protein [candidate division KSB1 bacterium]